MNWLVKQPYLLAVLCLCLTESDDMSLDSYCMSQVKGRFEFATPARVLKYIQMCRQPHKYVKCLLDTRIMAKPPKDVIINAYEKYLPKEVDLRRALFFFCVESSNNLLALIDVTNSQCEDAIDATMCEMLYASSTDMEEIEQLISKPNFNVDVVTNKSCKISAQISLCGQNDYVLCSKENDVIRNYEMSVFGIDCLTQQSMYPLLQAGDVCTVENSASLTQQFPVWALEIAFAAWTAVIY